MNPVKILLGGVPFGRNNVGDEAILECIVRIVRSICPEAEITVSTDDGPATAKKLQVKTVQLFGFTPPYSKKLMRQTLEANDLFIWSGATGLSDYPEIPTEMLHIAQQAGRKTVLFGVGMNHTLNPVKYTILPGSRRKLLAALTACSFGQINMIQKAEERLKQNAFNQIKHTLSRADLVALRDPQSIEAIAQCGEIPNLTVGADSAVILEPDPIEAVSLSDQARAILASDRKKIGICISAQREVTHTKELVQSFNQWVADDSRRIVFAPMNPLTDSVLMADLQKQMTHPERAVVIEGRREPAEILAIASQLDVIASSRLHLLILASIVHVPIVGISRGSKVDNFLAPFGLKAAGSVEECNFDHLTDEILRLLEHREAFESRSKEVRQQLIHRLDTATESLKKITDALAEDTQS